MDSFSFMNLLKLRIGEEQIVRTMEREATTLVTTTTTRKHFNAVKSLLFRKTIGVLFVIINLCYMTEIPSDW